MRRQHLKIERNYEAEALAAGQKRYYDAITEILNAEAEGGCTLSPRMQRAIANAKRVRDGR